MNGITRAASGASAFPPPATGSTNADQEKTHVPETSHFAQPAGLADRPPSHSGGAAERPRRALIEFRLASLTQPADNSADLAKRTATKVRSQIESGAIKLLDTHSATALTAAASAASKGLMALKRDFLERGDPLKAAPR